LKIKSLSSLNDQILADFYYRFTFLAATMIADKILAELSAYELQKSEEEECRICLDPCGKYRRCCKRYYCSTCYLKIRQCPGCGETTHANGMRYRSAAPRPSKWHVIFSWILSCCAVILLIGSVFIVIWNDVKTPITIWGHKCHGWFTKCDLEVCVDSDENSSNLPVKYSYCLLNKTRTKIIGNACVFDNELYRLTDKLMGFDFCYDESHTLDSVNENKPFIDGACIFEDSFDYWKNETNYSLESVYTPSARWAKIENAQVTNICGVNNITRKHEMPTSELEKLLWSPKSLVFSGLHFRFAETMDLDLRYGGE